jgi:hypothetical protein
MRVRQQASTRIRIAGTKRMDRAGSLVNLKTDGPANNETKTPGLRIKECEAKRVLSICLDSFRKDKHAATKQ